MEFVIYRWLVEVGSNAFHIEQAKICSTRMFLMTSYGGSC